MVLLTKLKIKCSGRNLAGVKRLLEHLLMMLIKALDFFFFVGRGGFDYSQNDIKSLYYFCSKRENDSIYPILS